MLPRSLCSVTYLRYFCWIRCYLQHHGLHHCIWSEFLETFRRIKKRISFTAVHHEMLCTLKVGIKYLDSLSAPLRRRLPSEFSLDLEPFRNTRQHSCLYQLLQLQHSILQSWRCRSSKCSREACIFVSAGSGRLPSWISSCALRLPDVSCTGESYHVVSGD